jgi:type II secretory pathway pseudopilin PulG
LNYSIQRHSGNPISIKTVLCPKASTFVESEVGATHVNDMGTHIPMSLICVHTEMSNQHNFCDWKTGPGSPVPGWAGQAAPAGEPERNGPAKPSWAGVGLGGRWAGPVRTGGEARPGRAKPGPGSACGPRAGPVPTGGGAGWLGRIGPHGLCKAGRKPLPPTHSPPTHPPLTPLPTPTPSPTSPQQHQQQQQHQHQQQQQQQQQQQLQQRQQQQKQQQQPTTAPAPPSPPFHPTSPHPTPLASVGHHRKGIGVLWLYPCPLSLCTPDGETHSYAAGAGAARGGLYVYVIWPPSDRL